jgi:hypothetical protein
VSPQMWTRDRQFCHGHGATMWLRPGVLGRIRRTTRASVVGRFGESR